MSAWLQTQLSSLMTALALPQFGLSTVFVVAFISATLLPLGSEPAVFGLIKLNPALFWPAVLVATAGNSLGGAVSWWMGRGAEDVLRALPPRSGEAARAASGCSASVPRPACCRGCPCVGDPLCAVAGWLKMPFWPCLGYMAIGKFAALPDDDGALLWVFPGHIGT